MEVSFVLIMPWSTIENSTLSSFRVGGTIASALGAGELCLIDSNQAANI